MIELLIGGILFYAFFRVFYYILKVQPADDTWGYFTWSTAGDSSITMNNNSLFAFDGTTNILDTQLTAGTVQTFELT